MPHFCPECGEVVAGDDERRHDLHKTASTPPDKRTRTVRPRVKDWYVAPLRGPRRDLKAG